MQDRGQLIGLRLEGAAVSEEQRRVDAVQAAVRAEAAKSVHRAPPPPAAARPLVPSNQVVDLRLAEELDYARRLLEMLGDHLANDPIILQRHGQAMQGFDRIGQIVGHVVSVFQAEDKWAAIERIGMQDMRARLTRRAL